jgi:ATP-binding cassette, subfamily B, bacterial
MAVLNDDINQLERFINDGVNQILQISISTIIIAIIFFFISAPVALLSFLPIPLIISGAFYFRHILAPRYLKVRNQSGLLSSRLNNNLSGISTIKSFATESYELKQVEALSHEYMVANKQAVVLSAAFVPIIRMGVMCGFLVSLIYGGMLTLDGIIAVASYSILIFLSQRLLWPLTYLGQVTDMYQRSMAAINRVMAVLNTPSTIADGCLQIPSPALGKIEFKNVNFAYLEREAIFNNLSFTINSGESVAFVGSTGAGKSTLVKLILRLYERSAGEILFDGMPLEQIKLSILRNHIGIVSQDTFLIDGSIADNISYGSFNATIEEIIAIAKLVEADEFIIQLPQGYDTLVGERGQKLSGGQRQRLALARAIIKNPELLILDEATSALDNQTESAIQVSLDKVISGRTTIMIAHRLSTVVNVDRIYVLEYGKIIEIGTHAELLAINGVYANLWKLQSAERVTSDTFI